MLFRSIEALVKEPIPRGAIPEGFELSEAAQRPARKEEDRRGPKPKGRGDKRERQIKPHGQEASTVALDVPPIEAAAIEDAPAAPTERRERRSEPAHPVDAKLRPTRLEGVEVFGDRRIVGVWFNHGCHG